MSYSTAELDAAWSQYVGLKIADWISLSNPQSAIFNADLTAKINYISCNRLYGFADYAGPAASQMKFQGIGPATRVPGFNGPTQS